MPAAIPLMNRTASKLTGDREFTDDSTRVFTTQRRVRFREMEYALPREAVTSALRDIERLIAANGWRISFPLEVRALAIALFYAIGTGIGGVAGPALFGALVDTGSRNSVFAGYLFGSALMIVAAAVAWRYAIAAERKSLESVARPLAFVE